MAEHLFDPAELYYLLTTFGATSAIGVDQTSLIGTNRATPQTQWELGYQQFLQRGWLARRENNKLQMDPAIALIGSIVADPKLALIATLYNATSEIGVVTYYLGDHEIIEQTYLVSGQYRFANILDIDTMVSRLVSTLNVPDFIQQSLTRHLLPTAIVEQAVRLAQGGRRAECAVLLAPHIALTEHLSVLIDLFVSARKTAEIEVGEPDNVSAPSPHGLIVLQSPTAGWMLIYEPPFDKVAIEQADAITIRTLVQKWVSTKIKVTIPKT